MFRDKYNYHFGKYNESYKLALHATNSFYNVYFAYQLTTKMLHKHVDSDQIMKLAKESPIPHHSAGKSRHIHTLAYGSRYATQEIPKFRLPDQSTEAQTAYQLIHDELELDGRPNMNLASFGKENFQAILCCCFILLTSCLHQFILGWSLKRTSSSWKTLARIYQIR
jgi:hypothetical protein